MSFAVPKNVPSFSNPNRRVEDHIWRAAGMTSRVGLFDHRNTLPMYKDKPYSYAASRRLRPMWRRKRTLLFFGGVVLFLWWFGVFSLGGGEDQRQHGPKWGWASSPESGKSKADWFDRRERVVEAFQLSWDAYERYAWGQLTA
jgi:mannosyl-oligosaccharide alpha-1,2-mannosidase